MAKKKKAELIVRLQDLKTEELKGRAHYDLQNVLSQMLRGAQAAHNADCQLELMKPEYSAALGFELEKVTFHLRTASSNLTSAIAAWEVMVERAKKGRKNRPP